VHGARQATLSICSIRGKGPADGDLRLLRATETGERRGRHLQMDTEDAQTGYQVIIRTEPTGAVSRRQHLTVTLEDMVCQECNNTWMSRLENQGQLGPWSRSRRQPTCLP
jgi:hypothetical protein